MIQINHKYTYVVYRLPWSLVELSKLIKDPREDISLSNFSSDLLFSASKSKVPSAVNTGLVTTLSSGLEIVLLGLKSFLLVLAPKLDSTGGRTGLTDPMASS